MNWANAVTFGRIGLVPLFLYLMYRGREDPGGTATSVAPWLAIAVFTAASLSDSLDGYLARRQDRVTKLGTFMDPLADKVLVGAALVTLVAFRGFPPAAAGVIAGREVAVSLLRSAVLRRGRSMPASMSGKVKTAIQLPMVLVWLLRRSGWVAHLQDAAVVAAVALTLISGVQYFARAGELLAARNEPTTR